MAVNRLGPDIRGEASRPARAVARGASDSWFKNCIGGDPLTGTAIDADFLNDWLAQLRQLLLGAGIDVTAYDDNWLARAVRRGLNRIPALSGTGTAMTATLSPAPVSWADLDNTPFFLITTDPNGANPTLNLNALGARPMKWADGSDIDANAWGANALLEVFHDGTNIRVLAGAQKSAGPPNRFAQSTPGSYTFTAPTTGWYELTLHGAGGGGGGGQATQGAAGGGGAGSRAVDWVFLSAGVAYSYTVGAGGGGGVIASNGANGGDTTFVGPSGTITAGGGLAGQGAANPGSGNGGSPGAVSGLSGRGYADIGQNGYQGAPQISQGGQGGSAVGGGFGGAASFGGGNAGTSPGGGGGGSCANAAGGNGGNGRLVVSWR